MILAVLVRDLLILLYTVRIILIYFFSFSSGYCFNPLSPLSWFNPSLKQSACSPHPLR